MAAVLEELDDLYERYTESRMRVFKALLREAVPQGEIDWYHAPSAIRPETTRFSIIWLKLMPISALSHQHSSKKILGALVIELVAELCRVFRQVPRFGAGGLLTVC